MADIDLSIFEPFKNQVIASVQSELILQGHVDTFALNNSIDLEVSQTSKGIIFKILGLRYLRELENGVPESEVNISISEYNRLSRWVARKKGVNIEEAKRIAYLMIRKWREEGKTTEASKQYSTTGERTNAVSIAVDKFQERNIKLLNEIVTKDIKLRLKNATKRK